MLSVNKRFEVANKKTKEEEKRTEGEWEAVEKITPMEMQQDSNLDIKIKDPGYLSQFQNSENLIA